MKKILSGILNIHPSLLPRWRGASPLVFSILFGDKKVGVSLMRILPKQFDIGPILDTREISAPNKLTTLKLLHLLANLGNEMVKLYTLNKHK